MTFKKKTDELNGIELIETKCCLSVRVMISKITKYQGLINWIDVKKIEIRIFLVVQWLRICLPMQGTQVRSLVLEDPTCHRATKPGPHNYCSPCA